ncbi:response regulator [Gymnodinialimonas ulvae]|uniref:response regulator n=1 Tax=Gymnodinialimonas ulvae TaxID=3126504 RepID=UPI0030A1A195
MARLLVMEDDALQRAQMVEMLEEGGHDVVACYTASEALMRATQEPFDLIVTDIIVKLDGRATPDGGISLIGYLRRMPMTSATKRSVPILAVSGTFKNPGMETILTTAVQVGATAQMQKPVRAGELLSKIDILLVRPAEE